jgi:hypothetical protein
MRRVAPALVLYVLSPFVAEFLLGDFPVTMLWLILLLGPMYGGGALLIRELTRRTGRGWPTMVLLGIAFGVVEEGLVTQSLFNPDYVGANLLERGFVPALGIAAPWTVFVLTIHTVFSIATPIAIVEEATSSRREQPWLRTLGFVVTCVLFALGALLVFAGTWSDERFLASGPQLLTVTIVATALVVSAFLLPRRRPSTVDLPVPQPAYCLLLSIVAGAVLMLEWAMPVWLAVTSMLAAEALMVALVLRWSARTAWGPWHRLALAWGALLTYAGFAFRRESLEGGSPTIDLISHITFAVAALAIIWTTGARAGQPPRVASSETTTFASARPSWRT